MIDLTNILLTLITVLLGIIGFFMVKFYERFEELAKDFHDERLTIARHDERLDALENM